MPLPVLFDGYPQSIPRKDAIFLLTDLRKENIIDKLTASGCGEVWYRAWFGTKRPRVRIPTLRPNPAEIFRFQPDFSAFSEHFPMDNSVTFPSDPNLTQTKNQVELFARERMML